MNDAPEVNDGVLNSQTPLPETMLEFGAPPSVDLNGGGAGTGFTATFIEKIPIADGRSPASGEFWLR